MALDRVVLDLDECDADYRTVRDGTRHFQAVLALMRRQLPAIGSEPAQVGRDDSHPLLQTQSVDRVVGGREGQGLQGRQAEPRENRRGHDHSSIFDPSDGQAVQDQGRVVDDLDPERLLAVDAGAACQLTLTRRTEHRHARRDRQPRAGPTPLFCLLIVRG